MGILTARPKLNSNETIRWKSSAGRVVSAWATSGGLLIITDQRMLFQPNRFDTTTGRKSWECPLDAVTNIEIIDREGKTLTGGVRKRLEVQTVHGAETFIVNKLEKKVLELRALLK